MSSLLIRNIGTIVLAETGTIQNKALRGTEMASPPTLSDAYLLVENEHIASFGPMSQCPERATQIIDAHGEMLLPAWCDSHTHIVFAATREEEFVDRIKGLSYEEIAARGGGILNSARRLQQCSQEELLESSWQRLEMMMRYGTGAIEIKSGYGLTLESELKMLYVIRDLKEKSPIPIKANFLGAHAIPLEYKNDRNGYIQLIINEMIPRVAHEGLAEYCDVFCDKGFYTVEETDQILKAAWKYGLKPKIHANELGYTGGVQIGVANKAVSVDHLEYTDDAAIEALLSSETLPTLLPSCAFFLGIPYAPARKMMDVGLPVVLATDYNPGSSPSGRMAFVVSLACIKMKMLPEEAVVASTLNGAFAMELGLETGSIAKGKKASFFLTRDCRTLAKLAYSFGNDPVGTVILNGSLYRQ